ncbi:MAG: hypothetical protein QNJ97_10735 [Myxococcota bacterium]|nr:hypothetical protein [Myxococcota bacterium]
MDENNYPENLKKTVIRICPACGVVNPAGPSETCPHVQLARFDGISDALSELLDQVASARREFATLLTQLKEQVKSALRSQEAEIETPRKARPSEVDRLSPRAGAPAVAALSLTNPERTPRRSARSHNKSQRPPQPASVDPRQLELIAREPPKGDA